MTFITIEGLGSATTLHPMQAAFVKHDGFQCGYCTPAADLFGGRYARRKSRRAGEPCQRVARRCRADRPRDIGTDERQSVPLFGLSQYRRCHCRSRGTRNPPIARWPAHEDFRVFAGGVRPKRPSRPAAGSSPGGTNLLDLMKLQIETPDRLVDISRLDLAEIEVRADGGLTIGALVAEQRSRRGPARDRRLSGAEPGAAGGGIRPVAQQGIDRGQSAAADALLLFLRYRHAVQQARARFGAARRSAGSTASSRSSARASSASRLIRATWR